MDRHAMLDALEAEAPGAFARDIVTYLRRRGPYEGISAADDAHCWRLVERWWGRR